MKMRSNIAPFRIYILLALSLGWIATVPAAVEAQEACRVEREQAVDQYAIGHTEEVIRLLSPCLDSMSGKNEKVEVYRLLALSYLAEQDTARAHELTAELMRTRKRYRSTDVTDDPLFKEWVDAYRTRYRRRRILLGSASGLAVGVAGYLLLAPGSPESLPFPPAGPQ